MGLRGTFERRYSFLMALKRVHITFTDPQLAVLEKLATKWGLDFTNTVRHCVMLCGDKEGIAAQPPKKFGRSK